jgi:hypothetical protein
VIAPTKVKIFDLAETGIALEISTGFGIGK